MGVMGEFVGWFSAERLVAAGTLGAVLLAVSDSWRRRIGDRKRHRRDLTAEVELRQIFVKGFEHARDSEAEAVGNQLFPGEAPFGRAFPVGVEVSLG